MPKQGQQGCHSGAEGSWVCRGEGEGAPGQAELCMCRLQLKQLWESFLDPRLRAHLLLSSFLTAIKAGCVCDGARSIPSHLQTQAAPRGRSSPRCARCSPPRPSRHLRRPNGPAPSLPPLPPRHPLRPRRSRPTGPRRQQTGVAVRRLDSEAVRRPAARPT